MLWSWQSDRFLHFLPGLHHFDQFHWTVRRHSVHVRTNAGNCIFPNIRGLLKSRFNIFPFKSVSCRLQSFSTSLTSQKRCQKMSKAIISNHFFQFPTKESPPPRRVPRGRWSHRWPWHRKRRPPSRRRSRKSTSQVPSNALFPPEKTGCSWMIYVLRGENHLEASMAVVEKIQNVLFLGKSFSALSLTPLTPLPNPSKTAPDWSSAPNSLLALGTSPLQSRRLWSRARPRNLHSSGKIVFFGEVFSMRRPVNLLYLTCFHFFSIEIWDVLYSRWVDPTSSCLSRVCQAKGSEILNLCGWSLG